MTERERRQLEKKLYVRFFRALERELAGNRLMLPEPDRIKLIGIIPKRKRLRAGKDW